MASWLRSSAANRIAKTSLSVSSRADTVVFVSLNITLVRTTAPASRQIRAKVLSGATARERNLPGPGASSPVAAQLVETRPALAMGLCDLQWQSQTLEHKSSEHPRLQRELRSSGAPHKSALAPGPE